MAISDLSVLISTSLNGFVKNFPAAQLQETLSQFEDRWLQEYSFGTGSNQANLMSASLRTATVGGDSINLRTGTLLDLGGNICTFSKVKELLVVNLSTIVTEDILLGGNFLISGSSEFIVGAGSARARAKGRFHIDDPFTGYDCNTSSRDTILAQATLADTAYLVVVIGLD